MADRTLSAADIRELLAEVDVELQRQGKAATIFVVGGAAMALAYNADRVTDDIDGTFEPRDVVLDAAAAVRRRRPDLGPHWLSDGVLQLMPPLADDHPLSEKIGPALTVSIASAEYVLAMKSMTSRQSEGDRADAVALCRIVGVRTQQQLEDVVGKFFPGKRFGAQELFFERIVDEL